MVSLDDITPICYFMLYNNYEGDIGSPLVGYEEYKKIEGL